MAASAAAAADLHAQLARCKEDLVRVSDEYSAHLETCNVAAAAPAPVAAAAPAAGQDAAQLQEKLILLAKGMCGRAGLHACVPISRRLAPPLTFFRR